MVVPTSFSSSAEITLPPFMTLFFNEFKTVLSRMYSLRNLLDLQSSVLETFMLAVSLFKRAITSPGSAVVLVWRTVPSNLLG